MSDLNSPTERTARVGFPLLHVGQAQKEVTINEAFALADALAQPRVNGIADTPPASPAEGECWIIAAGPSGAWTGRAASLAIFQAGAWIFCSAFEGLNVFDTGAGVRRIYRDGAWQTVPLPSNATGGAVVDQQARDQIATLCAALRMAGVL